MTYPGFFFHFRFTGTIDDLMRGCFHDTGDSRRAIKAIGSPFIQIRLVFDDSWSNVLSLTVALLMLNDMPGQPSIVEL